MLQTEVQFSLLPRLKIKTHKMPEHWTELGDVWEEWKA